MTEAAEFQDKSSMLKPHNQDTPSIFTGFDKAKTKILHKRRKKTLLLQKSNQEEQKLLWKMIKQDALFKARKQTCETTIAAELDLLSGEKYRDR